MRAACAPRCAHGREDNLQGSVLCFLPVGSGFYLRPLGLAGQLNHPANPNFNKTKPNPMCLFYWCVSMCVGGVCATS